MSVSFIFTDARFWEQTSWWPLSFQLTLRIIYRSSSSISSRVASSERQLLNTKGGQSRQDSVNITIWEGCPFALVRKRDKRKRERKQATERERERESESRKVVRLLPQMKLLYEPLGRRMREKYGELVEWWLTGENWNTRRETCPCTSLSTTNPTFTATAPNPTLRGVAIDLQLKYGEVQWLCNDPMSARMWQINSRCRFFMQRRPGLGECHTFSSLPNSCSFGSGAGRN